MSFFRIYRRAVHAVLLQFNTYHCYLHGIFFCFLLRLVLIHRHGSFYGKCLCVIPPFRYGVRNKNSLFPFSELLIVGCYVSLEAHFIPKPLSPRLVLYGPIRCNFAAVSATFIVYLKSPEVVQEAGPLLSNYFTFFFSQPFLSYAFRSKRTFVFKPFFTSKG